MTLADLHADFRPSRYHSPCSFSARYLAGRIVSPLEESYKRQRQFISDAGHELKTPVSVMNANLELLSREIGENQWLSNLQYENERMSGLIAQLLDLARTENVSPPMEPADFSRLTLGETLPFESVAFENGLQLETEIADRCLCGRQRSAAQTARLDPDGQRHPSQREREKSCAAAQKGQRKRTALCSQQRCPHPAGTAIAAV